MKVTGMLSGGFSGLSITHSDIGGYTTFAGVIPGLSLKVYHVDSGLYV
jgi:alpha-glucosidase (family GH31 glycosyl hydrolase)